MKNMKDHKFACAIISSSKLFTSSCYCPSCKIPVQLSLNLQAKFYACYSEVKIYKRMENFCLAGEVKFNVIWLCYAII